MHSLYSDDGEFTPTQLAEQCAQVGITMMSLTDHNCVAGNREAVRNADRLGLEYITGIEIDCQYGGLNFHLLGYGIDVESHDFLMIEQNIAHQTETAAYARLKATQDMGFDVTKEEMCRLTENRYWHQSWTGELFGEVLLNKEEYQDHPMLKPYLSGGARSDNPYLNFYFDYYAFGKPCYYAMRYPSMEEMVEVIHRNGGTAVLAHPGLNLKGNVHLLKDLCQMGVDGVETVSSYHSKETVKDYKKRAHDLGMFITGGSDYHGATKPTISLGIDDGLPDPIQLKQQLLSRHK